MTYANVTWSPSTQYRQTVDAALRQRRATTRCAGLRRMGQTRTVANSQRQTGTSAWTAQLPMRCTRSLCTERAARNERFTVHARVGTTGMIGHALTRLVFARDS